MCKNYRVNKIPTSPTTLLIALLIFISCESDPKSIDSVDHHAGNSAGDVAGSISGETVGDQAGEIDGELAGITAGDVAGESIGGDVAGELAGITAGDVAGESIGGDVAGESVGGDVAGESIGGDVAGESIGGDPLPTEPIEGCVGPMVASDHMMPIASSPTDRCVTCEGAPTPDFILRDLNPASCGVGQYYGLDAFQGDVTLVVLLRSTCSYCQGQLTKLEELRFELLAAGHRFWLVIINQSNTGEQVSLLTERSASSILQDVPEVNAWLALSDLTMSTDAEGNPIEMRVGGDKDDMYIYDSSGNLARFLDDDNREVSTNLSTEEGYSNLRSALLEVLTAE